jgi:hypothetical protein
MDMASGSQQVAERHTASSQTLEAGYYTVETDDSDLRRRKQLTKWCTQHHTDGSPGYCYIQLDGSHVGAEMCRCMYPGARCPVDFHNAVDPGEFD